MKQSSPPRQRRPQAKEATTVLRPRQLQILRLIQTYRESHGCSPTLQELAVRLRLSKVTVFEHVEGLVQNGLLRRQCNKARSLTIDPAVAARISEAGDTGEEPEAWETEPEGGRFVLAGEIAAGIPLEAIEDSEVLDLTELFTSEQETFALRVRGESMIDEQIRDGDFVLVKKTTTAREGEIAVALLENGEATLKKIYRSDKGYRLEGANPNFTPLQVDEVNVQGVVIGIVRRY